MFLGQVLGGAVPGWKLARKLEQPLQGASFSSVLGYRLHVHFQFAIHRQIHRFIRDEHLAIKMGL